MIGSSDSGTSAAWTAPAVTMAMPPSRAARRERSFLFNGCFLPGRVVESQSRGARLSAGRSRIPGGANRRVCVNSMPRGEPPTARHATRGGPIVHFRAGSAGNSTSRMRFGAPWPRSRIRRERIRTPLRAPQRSPCRQIRVREPGNRGNTAARAACPVPPTPFRLEATTGRALSPDSKDPDAPKGIGGDGVGPSVAGAEGRRREEPRERGTRVRSPHERLPDEKGVHSVASHQVDVRQAVDAALGHQERAGRNAIEE